MNPDKSKVRNRPKAAPLFGREAARRDKGKPVWPSLVAAVVVVVLAAAGAGYWTVMRLQAPDAGGQVVKEGPALAARSSEPKGEEVASAPPQPPPAPVPAESKAEDLASAPPQPPVQTVAPLPEPAVVPTQPDGHRDAVVWLAVSPDQKSLMSASTDREIKLWDFAGRHLIRNLGAHKDMARTALFLPDGQRALTAGDDGEIVLRSVADGAVLHVFSASQHGGANKLALSRDGRTAVSVHENGTIIVWDIENKAVRHVLQGHDWSISGVAVSPDGKQAISGSIDGELNLWDIDQGRLIRGWLGHERGTYGVVFTPDGRQAITGSGDHTIKVWDAEAGKELGRFDGHSGTVYALAISDDGKRLLSASLDGTARLWDMRRGDELMQVGHDGPLYAVAFGPDGTVVTGGIDRSIRIWPAIGGEQIALIPGAPD